MPHKQSMSAADSWRLSDLAVGIKRRFTLAASSDRMRDTRGYSRVERLRRCTK